MPLTIQVFIPSGETEATLTAITGTGTPANPYTITQQGSSRFGTITVADDADLLGLWQIEVGSRFVRRLPIVAGQADYPLQGSQEAAAAAITEAVNANQIATPDDVSPTIDFSPTIEPTELSSGSVNAIRDGLATTEGITSILNRIGAFTGSGVNTILGFLRAIARKDLAAPSDLGGDYTPANDSLEAIRDRGDAEWTGDAAGPLAQLVTFTALIDEDALQPVSGVSIRIAGRDLTTGTNGVVSVSLDPDTYAATVVVPNGYADIAIDPVVVGDSPVPVDLDLVPLATTTPAPAPQTNVQLPTEDQYGNRKANVTVKFTFLSHAEGATITGTTVNTPAPKTSDSDGICRVTLRRLANYKAEFTIPGDRVPKTKEFTTGNTGVDIITD